MDGVAAAPPPCDLVGRKHTYVEPHGLQSAEEVGPIYADVVVLAEEPHPFARIGNGRILTGDARVDRHHEDGPALWLQHSGTFVDGFSIVGDVLEYVATVEKIE
jgi:hypothetical protein